ncbi:MAG: flagellar M-ring protein FliF [Planctomycetota bacterium]|nr:MAG: flagellar M-ring protein FliF [Planctomycetota bacterium]
MAFIQNIEAIWRNVSLVQRALLIAIALAVVIVGALLTNWARRPDMRVLYSRLDPAEAAKVTEKISEKGIDYKLSGGGGTIYVPKENVTQLRLDMAKEGLPQGGQKGYGIFDDEKIGISPFVQNVNLKRALQEELAKSIQMIDGVVHARIHIVSPENTLFTSGSAQTSASVVLQLRPGHRLSALTIAAITHLVAGGIEGLKSEKVTVVDSQGRLLTSESDQAMAGGAGTVADYTERVEQNLATKIEDMLTAVLGPGRAMVRVSAEIETISSTLSKKTYDGGKAIPQKEEITSESETEPGEAAGPGKKKTSEIILTDYMVPETTEQTVQLAGAIKSLTVAAFVDLSPPAAPAPEEGAEATTSPPAEPLMTITEVEDIIKKAAGPKLTAEGLKVVDVKFNRPTESLLAAEKGGGLDFMAIARQSSLGIMAVCAILVLKLFSGSKKKAAAKGEGELLPDGGVPVAGFLPSGSDDREKLALRRQIADSLRSNPEQAKQLFSSWIDEKGGR